MKKAPDILDLGGLSSYLRIPRSTLYRLAQQGRIPGKKVGRQWRFLRAAVDRWLEERHRAATSSSRRGSHPRTEAHLLERDPTLAEIVRRLVDAYRPERIYLFGSKARGDAGADSDYDLLLVVPDDATPERSRSGLAYQVLWGTGAAADVLVWTKGSFESRLHLKASLPATVLREGKVLYAA
jgi:excisionase family DNA binding protein